MNLTPRRRAGALCALAALTFGCGGAARDRATGREILSLPTEHDAQRAGDRSTRGIEADRGVLNDAALTEYVQSVGRRLLRHAPRRGFNYQFAILDDFEPNAFALPDGSIYVSRGLLALINDEDELANVLGHEISHAVARHAAGRAAIARLQSPFNIPLWRMAELAAYRRDQELDADEGGQILAARAGHDPAGMVRFLLQLRDVDRLRMGRTHLPGFSSTHPGTTERVTDSAARANSYRWRRDPSNPDPRTYLDHLAGLVLGPNPGAGVFQGTRFLQPELDFQLRFPDGWELLDSPEAVGARSPDEKAVVFLRVHGKAGDPRAAAEAFVASYQEQFHIQVERSQPIRVNGIDAYQIDGEGRIDRKQVAAAVIFIPYRGTMYRITGVAPRRFSRQKLGAALNAMRSFRPLNEAERAAIRVYRLALAEALPGEGLAALGKRAGNAIDPQRTAILNGLMVNVRFQGGEVVKIARLERWSPGRATSSPAP